MVEKKKKTYKIVLGALYGDEGKGATVQWLCKQELDKDKKPVVVRFSGGAQAAHTVMQKLENGKDIRHVCSSLGSGVLLGVDTYLDENFFLDPIMLMEEIDTLLIEIADSGSALGKEFYPKVWINDWCRIVTPYDIIANRKDKKILDDGTCGKGIFTTCKRYSDMYHMSPLKKVSMKSQEHRITSIFEDPKAYLAKVKEYYGIPETGDLKDLDWQLAQDLSISTIEELDWKFCDAIERIKVKMKDKRELFKIREEDFCRSGLYDTVIYEGSQGLLLDAKHGFDPFTTSSLVGLNGIPSYITDGSSDTECYLVVRTYLTRHGKGVYENHYRYKFGDRYFQACLNDKYEYNVDNKFQGAFRKAVFDSRLLYRAIDRHCLDNYKVKLNLVITHADAITRFVTHYRSGNIIPGDDFKMPRFWPNTTEEEYSSLFPVIDRNGNKKEVMNIAMFKNAVEIDDEVLCPGDYRPRFISFWYSDNPYSEFTKMF